MTDCVSFLQGHNGTLLNAKMVDTMTDQLSLLEGVSIDCEVVQRGVALLGTVLATKLGISIQDVDEL